MEGFLKVHPHQQDPFLAFLNNPGGTSQWVDVQWLSCITDIHNKGLGIQEKLITVNTRRRVVHIILQVRTREQMFNDLWSATDANDFSRLGHRLSNIRTLILITNIKLYHPIRVRIQVRILCEYLFNYLSQIFVTPPGSGIKTKVNMEAQDIRVPDKRNSDTL